MFFSRGIKFDSEDSQDWRFFSGRILCPLWPVVFKQKPQNLQRSSWVLLFSSGPRADPSSSGWRAMKCLLVCIYYCYCVHMASDSGSRLSPVWTIKIFPACELVLVEENGRLEPSHRSYLTFNLSPQKERHSLFRRKDEVLLFEWNIIFILTLLELGCWFFKERGKLLSRPMKFGLDTASPTQRPDEEQRWRCPDGGHVGRWRRWTETSRWDRWSRRDEDKKQKRKKKKDKHGQGSRF